MGLMVLGRGKIKGFNKISANLVSGLCNYI